MMSTSRRIAEARLRLKNQVTVPEPIIDELGVEPNDTLVFEADPDRPGTATIRRLPDTFAGALTGIYGSADEVKAFLREEHAGWEE